MGKNKCCSSSSSSDKCCPKTSSPTKCSSSLKSCYNFGYWCEPRPLKCKVPKIYDECNFDKIPTGSIWLAQMHDCFGVLRTLVNGECFNHIGIVIQGKFGCEKVTLVFTINYGGVASLIPLKSLAHNPLIINQVVRPIFRTCNKCTDRKRLKVLQNLIGHYVSAPFEQDGAQVARNLFNLPIQNPTCTSFTDTELIYTILTKAGLLGDNCCPEYCNNPQPGGCCNGDVDLSTCSVLPCDKTCCTSSSSSDCSDCEPDGYLAASAQITDFLGCDSCLDLCWFAPQVKVFHHCPSGAEKNSALDAAFGSQGPGLIHDIRLLVDCWGCGNSSPCSGIKTRCPPIATSDCGCAGGEGGLICPTKVTGAQVATALIAINTIYSQISGVNYADLPEPIGTTFDGNDMTVLFNQIRVLLQKLGCCVADPFVIAEDSTRNITIEFVEPETVVVVSNACNNVVVATGGVLGLGTGGSSACIPCGGSNILNGLLG